MKKIFFLTSLLIFSVVTIAQSYDSWKIFHNRKLAGSFNLKKETNSENKVVLLNRTLEGPGFLLIEFTPNEDHAEWIRTIAFIDSADKRIKEYNNTLLLRIHNAEIAGILEGRQKVKVYSWATPKDPALAATVKVRRILLCTLYTR